MPNPYDQFWDQMEQMLERMKPIVDKRKKEEKYHKVPNISGDEELSVTDKIGLITKAASTLHCMKIVYGIQEKIIEPFSIKTGSRATYLYAWCRGGHITKKNLAVESHLASFVIEHIEKMSIIEDLTYSGTRFYERRGPGGGYEKVALKVLIGRTT